VYFLLPTFAVITVVPFFLPKTTPLEDTVATDFLLLLHFAFFFVPFNFKVFFWPFVKVIFLELIFTAACTVCIVPNCVATSGDNNVSENTAIITAKNFFRNPCFFSMRFSSLNASCEFIFSPTFPWVIIYILLDDLYWSICRIL